VCSKFETNSADKRECSYSPHHCWYQRNDEHYWQSKLVPISTSGSCISWRHDVLHSHYLLVLCSQLWSAIFRHLSWQESKRDNNFLMWIFWWTIPGHASQSRIYVCWSTLGKEEGGNRAEEALPGIIFYLSTPVVPKSQIPLHTDMSAPLKVLHAKGCLNFTS
jgi:hypothetical protein